MKRKDSKCKGSGGVMEFGDFSEQDQARRSKGGKRMGVGNGMEWNGMQRWVFGFLRLGLRSALGMRSTGLEIGLIGLGWFRVNMKNLFFLYSWSFHIC